MSRNPKNPLRPLMEEEREHLMHWSRGQAIAASPVARAKAVLAVAAGRSYIDAAREAGRRSGDAVATLVGRFNAEGLAAVVPRHSGGHPRDYSSVERERILAEARRLPDRAQDGTATWSLSTLQRALRRNGLPHISTYTIRRVLVDAGLSWQKHRSWCDTGMAQRPRKKNGQTVIVAVIDPDTEAKKNLSKRLTAKAASMD
ncbi:MAG: helix-turn-helix domain-containing protein [Candidatus Competibacter sp.]|nr:helix-turn-helix domain-containing protein [Candidatus Competibacter sp.]